MAMDYDAPVVTDYGTLHDLTAGAATGACLDADFPAGTPFDELTFTTPTGGC